MIKSSLKQKLRKNRTKIREQSTECWTQGIIELRYQGRYQIVEREERL